MTSGQAKAALAEKCVGYIMGKMRFWNPYWADRAWFQIRWAGNCWRATIYATDPNSGGRVSHATFYSEPR
jgi:hypothetical protein